MGRFGRESFRPWVVSASLNISPKIHLVAVNLIKINMHDIISQLVNKYTTASVHFHNFNDHKT